MDFSDEPGLEKFLHILLSSHIPFCRETPLLLPYELEGRVGVESVHHHVWIEPLHVRVRPGEDISISP